MVNKYMKRNLDIELMRYIMIISIAVLHFGEDFSGMMRTIKGGAIGVDFFFIVAGLFLAKHYYNNDHTDTPVIQTTRYMISRLKQLSPAYYISLFTISFIYFVENNFALQWLKDYLWQNKWQYLYLHYIYPGVPFVMRSTWYLSSLVFCMFIVYFLISYNDKLATGLLPIVSIVIYTSLYANFGNLSTAPGLWYGWISGGTLRGIAGMGMGVFLYTCIRNCEDKQIVLQNKTTRLLITILKYIIGIAILYLMYKLTTDLNDFFKVFLIIVFIRLAFYNCYEIQNQTIRKIIYWLGSINYWIFSIHLIISHILVTYFHELDYYIALAIYLTSITLISSICKLVENKILKMKRSKSYI